MTMPTHSTRRKSASDERQPASFRLDQTLSANLSASSFEIPGLTISEAVREGSTATDDPDVQVWRAVGGGVTAYCYELDGGSWIHWVGVARFCFDPQSRMVTAYPESDLDSNVIRETYWHYILPIIQHLIGRESLHASGVRTSSGVIGLCGPSMAGKSTLAFGLSRRGYALFSDDALVVDLSSIPLNVLSLPFKLRLRLSSAEFFGLDAGNPVAPSGYLQFRENETGKEPLAALFILEPQSKPALTEIVRLAARDGLTALLPHAHCFSLNNEHRKRQMMQNFLTLADSVPVSSVRYEHSFEKVNEILDKIEVSFSSSENA